MKKLLLLFLLGIGFNCSAQNVAACNTNAQNICSNPNFLFQGIAGTGFPGPLTISNPGTNPQTGNGASASAPANSGCLLTNGPGPQWLILTISASGNLGFIFGDPGSANPQVGLYDWAMWLYTPSTCANLFNNTQPPVSCNWNASASGGTGMGTPPPTGNAGNYQPALAVTAGQQYLILISNYSGVTTPVSFTSTGTASLTCGFNSAICAGNSTTVAPVGFAPQTNPSYTLLPSNAVNTTGIFTVTPLTNSSYTIHATVNNSQGGVTMQTSTTNITVNPQPQVAPTLTQTSCTSTANAIDLHFSLNPPSSTASHTVSWSTVPTIVTSNSQTAVNSGTNGNINPNFYTVTVTATGGCSVVTSFTINPQPAPATFTLIPLGSTYSVTCAHPNVVLDASNSALSYTWNNGTAPPVNDSEALFNASTLGTWTITGLNPASNCSATHVFTIVQNTLTPTTVITPSFQNITCTSVPQTVSLTASQTVNISHHIAAPGGAQIAVSSHTALYVPGPPGLYTDTVRNDANGCYSVKTFSIASSDAFPTLTVTSNNNFTVGCNSHSITLITITGDTPPPNTGGNVTYTLLPPPTPATYSFGAPGTFTISTPGPWIAVIKSASNGCQTKIPFSVIQYTAGPDIHADVPVQILNCNVNSTTLTGITADPHVDFSWTSPGPVTVINSSVTVHTSTNLTSTSAGIYTLTLLNRDNGCTSVLPVPIQQNLFPPKAIISGGVSTLQGTCRTQTVQMTNNSVTGITAASGYPTNQNVVATLWEGPTPQVAVHGLANYVGAVPGVYTMTALDLNNGCTSKTTTSVFDNRIYPSLVSASQPDTLDCGRGSKKIGVSITSSTASLSYHWIPQLLFSGSADVDSLLATSTGTARVLVTNTGNGCQSLGSVTLVAGALRANFAADHISGYAPLAVHFANNSTSLNSNSITSVWSFGNGTAQTITPTSAVQTPTALYTQPGTYTVTMFANKGACADTAIRYIHVDIPSRLNIPNVFTPNGDHVNDVFFLETSNLTNISASIYDRWGHKVYALESTTGNIEWDGSTDTGKDASAGTYFYVIKATGKDGQDYNTKGTISLFR